MHGRGHVPVGAGTTTVGVATVKTPSGPVRPRSVPAAATVAFARGPPVTRSFVQIRVFVSETARYDAMSVTWSIAWIVRASDGTWTRYQPAASFSGRVVHSTPSESES